jgi:hypothetical protein
MDLEQKPRFGVDPRKAAVVLWVFMLVVLGAYEVLAIAVSRRLTTPQVVGLVDLIILGAVTAVGAAWVFIPPQKPHSPVQAGRRIVSRFSLPTMGALFSSTGQMETGDAWFLVPLALNVSLLLLAYPSRARFARLLQD